MSLGLAQPLPIVAFAGWFGVASECAAPVWVNVGNSAIWLAVKEGPRDVGGQTPCDETWAAAIVGEATPPVAEAGYVPANCSQNLFTSNLIPKLTWLPPTWATLPQYPPATRGSFGIQPCSRPSL